MARQDVIGRIHKTRAITAWAPPMRERGWVLTPHWSARPGFPLGLGVMRLLFILYMFCVASCDRLRGAFGSSRRAGHIYDGGHHRSGPDWVSDVHTDADFVTYDNSDQIRASREGAEKTCDLSSVMVSKVVRRPDDGWTGRIARLQISIRRAISVFFRPPARARLPPRAGSPKATRGPREYARFENM